MPVSLLTAQGCVNSLLQLNAAGLFGRFQEAPHVFEKHYDKNKAQEAAGEGAPQGYFKRTYTIEIAGRADLNNLTPNKKQDVLALLGNPKKPLAISKAIGAYNKNVGDLHVVKTKPADGSDVLEIVRAVMTSGTAQYRQGRAQPNSRFQISDAMPAGFAGRAIDANYKYYDADHVVIVINSGGVNPTFVTVFPATKVYAEGTPPLV